MSADVEAEGSEFKGVKADSEALGLGKKCRRSVSIEYRLDAFNPKEKITIAYLKYFSDKNVMLIKRI